MKIRCNYFGSTKVVPKFSAVRFLPFLAHIGPFSVIFWELELSHFCPNMPLGVVYTRGEKNLLANQKWAFASNFCEPNFQEFRLKWWRKELFLHCGDELNGLGPSWMVLTHGNVIWAIIWRLSITDATFCCVDTIPKELWYQTFYISWECALQC